MVNNGASGACRLCKQKRKKCDETRPTCLRCSRARRECPGYELSRERKFINYSGPSESSLAHQRSDRLLSPTAGSFHHDMLDWPTVESTARLAFFDDYCLVSSNQDISRGYLHGLRTMIAKAGPSSELAQSCSILALANLGKRLGNTAYVQRAEDLYSSLLRSFRLSISNEAIFTTIESLTTAALLGLYEIITSTEAYSDAHVAHAQGISAILVSRFSPFDLVCGGKLFQVASPIRLEDLTRDKLDCRPLECLAAVINRLPPRFSIFCTSSLSQSNSIMDLIYVQTGPLIRRAETLLRGNPTLDDLRQLKFEAEQLKEAYEAWPKTISREWTPRTAGFIKSKDDEVSPDVGYWPGTVSSYYDPYVASIWNSYRKGSLLVLNVIMTCYDQINSCSDGQELDTSMQNEVAKLTEGIVSSIPYLLAADLEAFVEKAAAGSPPLVPGRPVGGLLSMYSLFVLSTLPRIEARLKVYMKECLAWVGTHMGIGQATVLSKCIKMDQFEYATEARVIIWTGMLI